MRIFMLKVAIKFLKLVNSRKSQDIDAQIKRYEDRREATEELKKYVANMYGRNE